jgi:hypothetical protein
MLGVVGAGLVAEPAHASEDPQPVLPGEEEPRVPEPSDAPPPLDEVPEVGVELTPDPELEPTMESEGTASEAEAWAPFEASDSGSAEVDPFDPALQPTQRPEMTEAAWKRGRTRIGVGLGISVAGLALGSALVPLSLRWGCGGHLCDPIPIMVGIGFGATTIAAGVVGTIITSVLMHRHRRRRPETLAFMRVGTIVWATTPGGLRF